MREREREREKGCYVVCEYKKDRGGIVFFLGESSME